ncbi:MAG: beta-ketoacyl-[acyl-carrier-protein] synthase family protein, partial [Planctomycetota bacterium]
MSSGRVVITGLGAVTPLGLTGEEMWAGLKGGKSGIGRISAFDPVGFTCQIAGEAPEYKIRDYVPKSHRKATKLMSRDIELSVIAALEAVKDSGYVTKGIDAENVNIDPSRTAINLGAGLISCDLVELAPAISHSAVDGTFDIRKWGREGLELVTPLWLLKYLPNMLPCHIGIIHDLQGPSNTITCGESGSLLAIAEASQTIIRGAADVAVAGGAEAKVNPIVMIRQCLLKRATSENNDEPAVACRPFDAEAKGSVFGEGAGIVILENLEKARERGARIYAEVVGVGESNSINPQYEFLEADGRGLRIAIEKAMAEAGIAADELDLVVPHGTGIPGDDLAEARAIEGALGEAAGKAAVWPTKSMLSNTGAACGALDVIAAARAMSEGVIPAAKNCERQAEGCNLNISKESVKKEIRYALCCTYT